MDLHAQLCSLALRSEHDTPMIGTRLRPQPTVNEAACAWLLIRTNSKRNNYLDSPRSICLRDLTGASPQNVQDNQTCLTGISHRRKCRSR